MSLCSGTVPVFPVAARPHASVAVLPFLNLGSDADSEYFSDGLTEELIHALSRSPGCRWSRGPRPSSSRARRKTSSKIGEQLKVSAVVEGSVRRLGDRIRVSTQLVNVSDGFCLWSQRFDCKMTDIFEVQEEIAQSIADLLKVELGSKIGSSGLVKRYTDNFEAYDLYLRGRFQWNKRSGEGFQKALEYYERALALDPNYAPAYAGIADYHVSVASWGLEAPTEAWPKAKEAVKKALAADDSLAEAHASMGVIRMWYEWNWKEAEREFLRAIELKPGLPISHVYYNLLLVQTGRFEEAEEQIRLALASDPLSVPANIYLAGVFHYRRDYDRSIEQAKRALEIDANDIEAHVVVALNLEQKQEYPQAIAELEKAHELAGYNPLLLGPLGSCYGGAGDKEKGAERARRAERGGEASLRPTHLVGHALPGSGRHRAGLRVAGQGRRSARRPAVLPESRADLRSDPRRSIAMSTCCTASACPTTDSISQLRTVTEHSGRQARRSAGE